MRATHEHLSTLVLRVLGRDWRAGQLGRAAVLTRLDTQYTRAQALRRR